MLSQSFQGPKEHTYSLDRALDSEVMVVVRIVMMVMAFISEIEKIR